MAPEYYKMILRSMGKDIPKTLTYPYWLPYNPFEPGVYELTITMQAWHSTYSLFIVIIRYILIPSSSPSAY
jgi:hypothetical protein